MNGERQTDARPGARARKKAFAAIAVFAALTMAFMAFGPDNVYLWIKAFHIIAVICWMAALLYMPRLFVYHTDAPIGSTQSETFKVMEQRLLDVIMRPAMMMTWLLGLYLAWSIYGFQGGWLHAKILAVIAMTAVHVYYSMSVRRFALDSARKSARHWRMMNEIPAVLMIAVVILAVVKPF